MKTKMTVFLQNDRYFQNNRTFVTERKKLKVCDRNDRCVRPKWPIFRPKWLVPKWPLFLKLWEKLKLEAPKWPFNIHSSIYRPPLTVILRNSQMCFSQGIVPMNRLKIFTLKTMDRLCSRIFGDFQIFSIFDVDLQILK